MKRAIYKSDAADQLKQLEVTLHFSIYRSNWNHQPYNPSHEWFECAGL